MGSTSRFLRGTFIAFVGILLGSASEFGARLIAARYLSPDEYGFLVLGFTILNITVLVALVGTHTGIARYLKDTDNGPVVFSGTLVAVVGFAIAAAAALLLLRSPILAAIGLESSPSVFLLFVVAIPFLVVVRLSVGGFRGLEQVSGKFIIQNLGVQTFRFVLIIAFALSGAGVVLLAVGWVLPVLLGAVVAVVMLFRQTDLLQFTSIGKEFKLEVVNLLRFSAPLMLSGMIWLLIQYTDNLLVGFYLTSEAVGLYNSAFTLAEVFLMFPAAFGFLYLPMFTEMYTNGESESMWNFYTTTSKWMVFVSFPIYLMCLLFPAELLAAIYGTDYLSATLALRLVATGLFTHVLFGLNGNTLVSIGRQELFLYGNIFGFVTNIALNLALIPEIGIEGAAVASAVAFLVVNGYWGIKLYQNSELHPITASLIIPLSGTTVTMAVVWYLIDISGLVQLFAIGAVCAAIHFGSIALLGGIRATELKMLQRFGETRGIDTDRLISVLTKLRLIGA